MPKSLMNTYEPRRAGGRSLIESVGMAVAEEMSADGASHKGNGHPHRFQS